MGARTVAALSLLLACAGPATARGALIGTPLVGGAEESSGPLLGLGLYAGATTNSYLRVREGSDRGTYLYLSDDLGIPVGGEARLQLGWRFDADDALALATGYIFLGGGSRTPTDLHFNGATFQGGTPVTTSPGSTRWITFELQYERALARFGETGRGLVALDVGLRFDYLNWGFAHATLAPTTAGHEKGEDFYKQSNPIPIVGLTVRVPLGESLDLVASARGFRLNHIGSGRSEGGIVYVSQSVIDASIGPVVKVGDSVEVAFGYRFLYLDIDCESGEDGNLIGLFAHGAYFSVSVGF